MAKQKSDWHVITGAPSSGKSTIITRLQEMGYDTVEEGARVIIDRELAKGKTLEQVNVDSPDFEEAWVRLQVDLEAKLDRSKKIIFDRGILDTLAYYRYYGWTVSKQMQKWCESAKYKKVFLFELLDYEQDYARIETSDTADALQDLFHEVYKEAGYNVILIPKDTVENRLKLVVQHIGVL